MSPTNESLPHTPSIQWEGYGNTQSGAGNSNGAPVSSSHSITPVKDSPSPEERSRARVTHEIVLHEQRRERVAREVALHEQSQSRFTRRLAAFAATAILAVTLLVFSLVPVPAGSIVGVARTDGSIEVWTEPGTHFKAPWERALGISSAMRQVAIDEHATFSSRERVAGTISARVIYAPQPSSLMQILRQYGGLEEFEAALTHEMERVAASTLGAFSAREIWYNDPDIMVALDANARKMLDDQFGIKVERVSIVGVDFDPRIVEVLRKVGPPK